MKMLLIVLTVALASTQAMAKSRSGCVLSIVKNGDLVASTFIDMPADDKVVQTLEAEFSGYEVLVIAASGMVAEVRIENTLTHAVARSGGGLNGVNGFDFSLIEQDLEAQLLCKLKLK